jgi:hypothetical protein
MGCCCPIFLFLIQLWKKVKQETSDVIIVLQPLPGIGGDHPRAVTHPSPDQNQNVNVKLATSIPSVTAAASQAVASKQNHEQQRLTHEQVCFTHCTLTLTVEGRSMNN